VSNRVIGRIIRVFVAFVGGLVFAYLCWVEAIFGGANLMNFIHGWSLPAQETSDLIYRGKLGDVYVQFLWLGVLLAAGISFALFTLEPVGKRKLSVLFYLFLLLLLLPLSVANYYTIAFWTERLRQAIFDVVLVLLGLAATQRLLAYKVLSIPGRITRGLAIFLLAVAAVIIPGIYSVIWFLSANGLAKSAAQVHGARPSWISVIATTLAAAFAILTFRFNQEPKFHHRDTENTE
jgi:hypothetical protein